VSDHGSIALSGTPGSVVTSVRIVEGPAHDLVRVWNRHGLAGELVVRRGDCRALARLLVPGPTEG